jgi:hypothetical protein
MKYIAGSVLFGLWGRLVSMTVLEETGSAVLAALSFSLTVAAMIWGFDQRRRLDE